MTDADVIVVGAGLAGLVAAAELADAGRRVILVDQEPEQSLGGQAFWSFGGLFLVNSPEQRRLRVRDTHELAWQDWLGTAGFDREEDHWPRRWAQAYVDFAAGEKRAWLPGQAVIVTSGGIGGNHELVRRNWPQRLGAAPQRLVTGVPAHVDGRMLGIAESAGANLVNRDRMWHYTEGITNWNPIWPGHGI